MKKLFIILILLSSSCFPLPKPTEISLLSKSVVLINIHSISGDGTATGFSVLDGKHILTNKHVCEDETLSQYTITDINGKEQNGKWIKNSEDTDLCLLEIKEKIAPVEFAKKLPGIGTYLLVIGYPLGTFNINTGYLGLPAEVFVKSYSTSVSIHPGHSGSPAFVNGKVVGIMYAAIRGASTVSFMISIDEIRTFFGNIMSDQFTVKYFSYDNWNWYSEEQIKYHVDYNIPFDPPLTDEQIASMPNMYSRVFVIDEIKAKDENS